jgi:hypothetical protein
MPASVATAELALKVDVNVGDPVTPAPVEVTYPALLDEPFTLVGYPLATVLAEKLVTMISRGDTTTRDRDFADMWLLTGRHRIGVSALREAIVATADVTAFVDPVLDDALDARASWDPAARRWST